jgi:hypothetical protein
MMSAPKGHVGAEAAGLGAERDGVVAQVTAFHALEDQVVAMLQATGADAASGADSLAMASIRLSSASIESID